MHFSFVYYFFLCHTIISYFIIKHIYRALKSDKLDIINLPLDHLARLSACFILCAKGVCDQVRLVRIAMGILLGIYTYLHMTNKKPIFGSLLGPALKTILPNNEVQTKILDLIKKIYF